MQFIEGGPHIPDELIEQLEEGNVVLFAGAGVSKNVGLPLFDELVNQVYDYLAQPMHEEEKQEFDNHNYDRVLGLLETRIGRGLKVREAVKAKLAIQPNRQLPLHSAILHLASTIDGAYRLVTTNFDRGFVLADSSITFEAAPAVPVPRRSRWYRPVHLHGLIGAPGRTLHDLVLTSADFGDAYITSGWASRFVSEMFARFSVLFVGYSISDPVMRYLVDALAVSRAHGEQSHTVYALVPADSGEEKQVYRSWAAKGVTAVEYYRDPTHSRLEKTLIEWAAIHTGGQAARLSVVARLADDVPSQGEDHRASQMVWALADKTGQAARKFASLAPPIGWLPIFERNGLMNLPMPVNAGPDWLGYLLQPVSSVSSSLHNWLLSHLEKPELVERAIKRNSILERGFRWELHRKLWYLKEPVAAPYRRFWELLGSTSVMDAVVEFSLKAGEVVGRLNDGQCDPLLFIEAIDQLRPIASLSKPTLRRILQEEDGPPKELSDLTEFDLRLLADMYTREVTSGLKACCEADPVLIPSTILGVTSQLERALKLFAAAGKAGEEYDPSIFQMESLSRNSDADLHPWTALIALARDLFIIAKDDGGLARAVIGIWFRLPYPIFLRLALFGMNESDSFDAGEASLMLLQIPTRRFWHYSNEESLVPLVAKLWQQVKDPEAAQLIDRILDGPPRAMFRADLSEGDFVKYAGRMRLTFLAAMESAGRPLPNAAAAKLATLRSAQPQGSPAAAGDDFVDGPYGLAPAVTDSAVTAYNQLMDSQVLEDVRRRTKDDRQKLSLLAVWGKRYPDRALGLLDSLIGAEVEDVDTFQALFDGIVTLEPIPERIIAIIPKLSKEILSRVVSTALLSMERVSESRPVNAVFLAAWDALAEVADVAPAIGTGGSFERAFGSQFGQLTMLLLNRWLATSPRRATELRPDIRDRLVSLLRRPDPQSRVARVMMAAYLYSLHFVDRTWTFSILLPLFDWASTSAPEMWQGYLHNHHWYPDLLADLKPSLLAAFRNRNELGEAVKGLWQLLAGIVVYSPPSLSDGELRDVLQILDKEALAAVASSFVQIVNRSEPPERASLWQRGISRALRLWPLDTDLRSEELSQGLVTLAILEQDLFEEIATHIGDFLEPVKDIQSILYQLCKTKLPESDPRKVAELLSKLVHVQGAKPYVSTEAHHLLQRLRTADPGISATPEFNHLAKTGWFDI